VTIKPFRLVQISDCHLPADPRTLYRGRNADWGLESLVEPVAAFGPQLVLATGDLSEDASEASYDRLQNYFRRLGVPVCALPGNHDDSGVMRHYFPDGPWNGPLIMPAGEWRLVLLGSAVAGRIDGVISADAIGSVQAWLDGSPGHPVMVALHHQPVEVGSPWIDRYPLQAPGPLLELVQRHHQVRGMVWGHVHQEFDLRLGNARLLACPSTAANSRPVSLRFTDDPAGPACRWMLLHADGELETGLLRAD
jgi:3',5'-cyclic-AMP phosphodiesterase